MLLLVTIRQLKCIFIKALTPLCASRPCASDLTGLTGAAGTIVIGYRGTFAFGKDGLSDVKFRKLTRILVHGKVSKMIYISLILLKIQAILYPQGQLISKANFEVFL